MIILWNLISEATCLIILELIYYTKLTLCYLLHQMNFMLFITPNELYKLFIKPNLISGDTINLDICPESWW